MGVSEYPPALLQPPWARLDGDHGTHHIRGVLHVVRNGTDGLHQPDKVKDIERILYPGENGLPGGEGQGRQIPSLDHFFFLAGRFFLRGLMMLRVG